MAALTPEQLQNFSRRRLGLQNEADTSRRRAEEDYGITNARLTTANADNQHEISGDFGSRGMGNSGMRINAQGQAERSYNEGISDLNLQRSRSLEDISSGLARGLADIDYNQSASLAEQNRQEQDRIDRRALLEAQSRAAAVGPPAYPNPVISLPAGWNASGINSAIGNRLFPDAWNNRGANSWLDEYYRMNGLTPPMVGGFSAFSSPAMEQRGNVNSPQQMNRRAW